MSTITVRQIREDERLPLPGGRYAVVKTERDEDMGPPWKEHDGHGPVSEWTHRDKRPGEVIINSDHGSRRYYDVAAATVIAKRDQWGLGPKEVAELTMKLGRPPTDGEVTAESVRRDMQRMKDWCDDHWNWIGVIVTLYGSDGREIDTSSLWGIESDGDYWKEIAVDYIDSLCAKADREQTERTYWEQRDTVTA